MLTPVDGDKLACHARAVEEEAQGGSDVLRVRAAFQNGGGALVGGAVTTTQASFFVAGCSAEATEYHSDSPGAGTAGFWLQIVISAVWVLVIGVLFRCGSHGPPLDRPVTSTSSGLRMVVTPVP